MILANLAVMLGALVQGSVGFAGNLVAVPLVLLAAPTFVPVATLANSALRAGMVLHRERTAVDWPGARQLVLGQVPGLALGAVVVALAPRRLLEALLAVVVLAAVPLNWRQRRRAVSGRGVVAVAVASGVMTTIGSIGGPLLALLWLCSTSNVKDG